MGAHRATFSRFTRALVSSPELRRQSTSVKQPLRYPSVRPTACLRVAAKPSRPALRSAKASGCPAAAVAASATGGAPLRASPQGEAWAGRIPASAQESLATLYRSTSPLRFTSTAFSACATGSAPEPFVDSTKASPGGEVAREARRRGVPVRLPQALWPCGRLIAAPTVGTGVWWMCRGRCPHRPEPAADGSVRRKHSGGAGWFASGGELFTAEKFPKCAGGCGTAETPLRQACGLPPPLKGRLGPIRLQGVSQRPHGLPRNKARHCTRQFLQPLSQARVFRKHAVGADAHIGPNPPQAGLIAAPTVPLRQAYGLPPPLKPSGR